MTQFTSLTEANVRDLAGGQSFDRGYHYYHNGAVSNVIRRGNVLTAEVEGSSYEPYQIQITLIGSDVDTFYCSCPYDWGGICKHIVATLLVLIHDGEKIEEKPELASLVADFTADQLRQVLLGVAAAGPEFAKVVEQEAGWIKEQPAVPAGQEGAPTLTDIHAIRREILRDFRQAGKGGSFEYDYYDEYAAFDIDPEGIVLPHLSKITALLDANDVDTAGTLISTIIEAFIEGLADLDDYFYEYNEDNFGIATLTLDAALAEVLLSQDMSSEVQEKWLAQIADWEKGVGDLGVARTAIEQGWTYPPLVAAMQGNISEKGAWAGEAPYYADELALTRLRILARQGRQQEYIHLAAAEGQTELSITMLVKSGQTDEAVAEAKKYLDHPVAILAVARALTAQGAMTAALDVAAHGLTLKQEWGMLELARWVREMAGAAEDQPLALQAAQVTFAASPTLADYTAVQSIAGTQWPDIRPQLLQQLRESQSPSHQIDIYLHENMLAEAMAVLDEEIFTYDADLRRVVEATRTIAPEWGIRKYRQRAEEIMNAGRSGAYDTAVYWLREARDIYQQHGRLPEWQHYLDSLLKTHQRKYKLVPMLRTIR